MSKLTEVLRKIQTEPNDVVFEYRGFKCRIWRHREFLTLNGYVGLPKGHRYYRKDYDAREIRDLQVHGGITFSGFWPELDRQQETPDGLWYLGFDTAHCNDYTPGTIKLLPYEMVRRHESIIEETYKDIAYVSAEIKNLVEQL